MTHEEARHLLDQVGVLKNACDLDLFMFFARHPRSLLSSESLAAFLGYELKAIADSLEALLAAGLLDRRQTPAHAARLYLLAIDTTKGGHRHWLASLLGAASTREGRLVLRQALTRRPRPNATSRGLARIPAAPLTSPRRSVPPKRRTGTE